MSYWKSYPYLQPTNGAKCAYMIFTEVKGAYDEENKCFIPKEGTAPESHIALWKEIDEEQEATLEEAACVGTT